MENINMKNKSRSSVSKIGGSDWMICLMNLKYECNEKYH